MTRPVHVLVVDDSAVVREAMQAVLSAAGDITVTTAPDPVVARRRIAGARPDAILLDLEMPREDGLTFLRELMATDPIPVVICSSHTTQGSRVALEALREGAVDVVAKPRLGVRDFVHESAILLGDAVRAAAAARVPRRWHSLERAAHQPPATPGDGRTSTALVAIAASTGGPQALREVLGALPAEAPGIVAVQHMPAGFTAAFARSLDAECQIDVKEAAHGDRVVAGRALLAPGDRHLEVCRDRRDPGGWFVTLSEGPLVSRHRPSADVLFRSVARAAGPAALGVIMTGMGDDGARGLLELRRAGAATLAQDEGSCVVYGMPKEAVALGAAGETVPLKELAARIRTWTPAGLPG